MPSPSSSNHPPQSLEEPYRLFIESVEDYAMIMLDPDGRVTSWNRGARRIEGYSADEVLGRSFEIFYTAEAVAAGRPQAELERALAEGRVSVEDWRVRKDGSRYWAGVVVATMFDEAGIHRGFATITRDLSERREHEERLRRSEEQFKLLVQSVTDYAIFMLDTNGTVASWNTGAKAIKGYSADEIIGRNFSVFYEARDVAAGKPAAILRRALEEGHAIDEGWRVRKDGSMFWAAVAVTPVFDASGVPRGYAKVTRDATGQRRLEELEVSSRRMVEFLAMLGHELRNPLTPICNSVALLRMISDGAPGHERPLAILERQTEHLARLVDDLLDIGRITSGKIPLQLQRIDLAGLVRHTVETIRSGVAARSQRFVVTLPSQPIEIVGDDTRLSQVLHNLLGNASKFTPDGGEIRIEAKSDGRIATVVVSDTGRGVASEALERIFELFEQERAGAGLGIGLSLARRLVELHGGTLSAASEGPGLGSSFTVSLPTAARDVPESMAEPEPPIESPARHVTRRVLVVDDNADAADTLVELLKRLGHEALAAYSAEESLAAAETFRPAVVLLDLNMPGEDGFAVLGRLRERAAGRRLFVAALTGYGQRTDRERTRAAGFDAHLTKPVSVERLEQILRGAGLPAA